MALSLHTKNKIQVLSKVYRTHRSGLHFCQSPLSTSTVTLKLMTVQPYGTSPNSFNLPACVPWGFVHLLCPLRGQQGSDMPRLQVPAHPSIPQRSLPHPPCPRCPAPLPIGISSLTPRPRICKPCSFVHLLVCFPPTPNRRPFWSCSLQHLKHSTD